MKRYLVWAEDEKMGDAKSINAASPIEAAEFWIRRIYVLGTRLGKRHQKVTVLESKKGAKEERFLVWFEVTYGVEMLTEKEGV